MGVYVMTDNQLPPLPDVSYVSGDASYGYDAEDMHNYARAALAQRQGDLVAHKSAAANSVVSHEYWLTQSEQEKADWPIPLYTAATAPAPVAPDDVLEALDLSPGTFRTEGGAINTGKLRAAILHPYDYLPPDHWMQARFSEPGGRSVTTAPTEAEQVCMQAYQVVGSMLSDLGQFNTERATKILDNLSQHRMVHEDVLPWPSFDKPVATTQMCLYEHADGHHLVTYPGAAILLGDPQWVRVGPVVVQGVETLTDVQIAAGVVENMCGLGSGEFPDVAFSKGARWAATLIASAKKDQT